MDADVLPLGNLDYMFEMSEQKDVLRENFIVPAIGSPANAGFFMVAPYPAAIREVNGIIRATEDCNNLNNNKTAFFDPVAGWGHVIREPDCWEKPRMINATNAHAAAANGTAWKFAGATADQGLLYHYVKYHRKSVSTTTMIIAVPRSVLNLFPIRTAAHIRTY